MGPVKIYLCDLTHTGMFIATEFIPLNIGLLASYAKKIFGNQIEITLFKYPEEFLDAIKNSPPDIVGASNYNWNSKLSSWALRKARQYNPQVLSIMGGWNYPLTDELRIKFLKKRPEIDIYVAINAELTFNEIIERYLEGGREKVLSSTIKGAQYLLDHQSEEPSYINGGLRDRIQSLDDIPSPYVNGMLDKFFDGKLTPLMETMRGCPFTCNYCNMAVKEYSKASFFSNEYVYSELDYIASRIVKLGIGSLVIADSNFGMFLRDKPIAEKIGHLHKTIGWPHHSVITTGKNLMERVLAAVECMKETLVPYMSVQSMYKPTLDEIKRVNTPFEVYQRIAEDAAKRDFTTSAEVICPLPLETKETYFNGINQLIDADVRRVVSHTLQLNMGTPYESLEYQQQHGYQEKFRLIPYDFGRYDGEFICDIEAVAVSSKYLSFQDYLEIREFALLTELFLNNNIFFEFTRLLNEIGISTNDFITGIRENIDNASTGIQVVRKSFVNETQSEIFNTEEEAIKFYSTPENYQKLLNGEVGGNVIFKHKSWAFTEHIDEMLRYVHNTCTKIIQDKGINLNQYVHLFDLVLEYCHSKLSGLFDPTSTDIEYTYNGNFDIDSWKEAKISIGAYKEFLYPTHILFKFSDEQKIFRKENFTLYGATLAGKSKIFARVPVFNRFFRIPHRKLNIDRHQLNEELIAHQD